MDPNKILSVSEFCNLSTRVEKISIRGGAVMGRELPRADLSREAFRLPTRSAGGYDYVEEYVKEEEEALLKGRKLGPLVDLPGLRSSSIPDSSRMEDITSIGSLPNLGDVDEDSLQVYNLYKFTPRTTDLPVERKRDMIVKMIETNQVVVILGSTGCGKTTQVPQFILDYHARIRKRCNIIVTQPRRIAATSVAKRVAYERGWEVSTIVGYQIGLDNKTSPDTRLTYCTTGVLREKLVRERNMMEYTHVILDEVHERDLEMDFLMLIVRKLLRSNSRTVKVILMSATIDPTHFAKYFSLPIGDRLCPAPVLDIEKNTRFAVKEFYINQLKDLGTKIPEFDINEPLITDSAYEIAVNLIIEFDKIDFRQFEMNYHRTPAADANYKPAILVFLPGIHEIEAMLERLEEKAKKNDKYKWHIIPLHSSITKDEQNKVFRHPANGYRKVILSTNIAESSITVDDVEYVIDFCLTKQLVCDPDTNFTSLRVTWASHSNCKQRAGRAGRVTDGRVYRMVPQFFYERLPQDNDPEMLRCPLTQTFLKAKMLKMGHPKSILAMALDPPDLTSLAVTVLQLKEAGAILKTSEGKLDQYDGDITFLGTVMSNLPIDIQFSKLILLGHTFSILEESIVIAAWMTVRNVFTNDFVERLGPYGSKIGYTQGSNSDCIAYLNVHKMYQEKLRTNYFKTSRDNERDFCKRHFLNLKAMREANELVDELRKRLTNLGIMENTSEKRAKWDSQELPLIRKIVIAGAFYPNYFVRGGQVGQIDEHDAVKLLSGKDPYTTVYVQGMPADQPGVLYRKVFKDIFESSAGAVSNVSLDGSSKVYIEFKRVTNKDFPGRISYPVYRAIKMKQLKMPIEVPMLRPEDARKRVEELGISSSNYLSLGKSNLNSCSRLPSLLTEYITFYISYIKSPSNFWIHSGIENDLERVQQSLNDPLNSLSTAKKLRIGEIYLAPYQGRLYRGQVSGINSGGRATAKILFVDYGNEENVPVEHIYEFAPEIADLKRLDVVPPFALECTLTGIGPSSLKNKNDLWSKSSILRFQELISHKEMLGEVYSVVDGLLSLKVFLGKNESVTINDVLVREGLAIQVSESYRSQKDHNYREVERTYGKEGHTCPARDPSDLESSESNELCSFRLNVNEVNHNLPNVADYVEPPSRRECHKIVRFKGPSSPLEMRVHGCSRVTVGKEISIDLESVNCVLLDSNPEDPHERLLVAGYVGTNPSQSRLVLGHTTLMPNMHGLSSLICLVFSPTVELRLSADKTRYIGALCGLGCDPNTGASYFPEKDMEITFDVNINVEDMNIINKLRFWMNKPLITKQGDDMSDITRFEADKIQHKVREFLLELLLRNREDQEVELFPYPHQWLRWEEDRVLVHNHEDERAVYPLHNALRCDLE